MAIAVKAGTLVCSFIFAALLGVALSGCNQDQSNSVGITSSASSTPDSLPSTVAAPSNSSTPKRAPAPESTLYPVSQFVTGQPPLTTLSRPAYLRPTAFPGMDTSVMRISDAAIFGIGQRYYRHYYSKQQPWNSDGTRLMLSIDAHRVYFLDGKTFAYLWTATNVPDYTKWSNNNPDLMYGTLYSANAFVTYAPSTGVVHTLASFSGFSSLFLGMGEGNLSNDDRYAPLIGEYATGFTVIIYDTVNNVEVSRKDFPGVSVANLDWVSMSQSGQYVVVNMNDGTTAGAYYDVYDTQMNYLRTLNAYAGGHADFGYDSMGNEVIVYGQYVGAKGVLLMSTRLADNTVQQQLPGISEPAGIYMASNYHISCRNINRPGYCYVSNFAFGYALDAYMFHEVFAVKLDGSGSVQIFSRDFAAPVPLADLAYFRESQVVPSRDGSLALFSSDWGDPSSTAIIYDYVAGVELN